MIRYYILYGVSHSAIDENRELQKEAAFWDIGILLFRCP